MNELQAQIFDIFELVDQFCKENNIQYLMYYGTLLGAVRHKGFIPWDDDIDIIMDRKSFEVFTEKYIGSDLEKQGYLLQSRTVHPYLAEESIRIRNTNIPIRERQSKTQKGNIGPWLDIFAFDHVPDNEEERVKQMEEILWCNKWIKRFLLVHVNDSDTGIKRIIKGTIQFLNEKFYRVNFFLPYLFKKRYEAMTRFNDIETEFSADLGFIHYKNSDDIRKSYYENRLFSNVTSLKFEEHEFTAPSNFELVLERNYGDYMKIPEIEEQKSHMIEEL